MSEFNVGQNIGNWNSFAGKADIAIKEELGSGYKTKLEAEKTIIEKKEQGVITKEHDGKYHSYTINDGAVLDDLNLGEKINKSAKSVVDFIGDDNSSLIEGKNIFLPPKNKDNGKVVHIFTAFPDNFDNIRFGKVNLALMSDDIKKLQNLGYTVKIDENGTKKEFKQALYDNSTAGMIWVSHGIAGTVIDHNKKLIPPWEIEQSKVSKNLKMVVFESCEVGKGREGWKNILNDADITAWNTLTSNSEFASFNMSSLDDKIEKTLGGDFAKTKYIP